MVCAFIFLGIFNKDKKLHSQRADITKYFKTSCIEHTQKVGNRSPVSAKRIIYSVTSERQWQQGHCPLNFWELYRNSSTFVFCCFHPELTCVCDQPKKKKRHALNKRKIAVSCLGLNLLLPWDKKYFRKYFLRHSFCWKIALSIILKNIIRKKSNTSHFRWHCLEFLQHVLLRFDLGWFSPYLKQVKDEERILSVDFVLFILTVFEALEKFFVFHFRSSIWKKYFWCCLESGLSYHLLRYIYSHLLLYFY